MSRDGRFSCSFVLHIKNPLFVRCILYTIGSWVSSEILSSMLDTRCLMLDARYSILDAGYSILDAGYSVLDARFLILDSRYSMRGQGEWEA